MILIIVVLDGKLVSQLSYFVKIKSLQPSRKSRFSMQGYGRVTVPSVCAAMKVDNYSFFCQFHS